MKIFLIVINFLFVFSVLGQTNEFPATGDVKIYQGTTGFRAYDVINSNGVIVSRFEATTDATGQLWLKDASGTYKVALRSHTTAPSAIAGELVLGEYTHTSKNKTLYVKGDSWMEGALGVEYLTLNNPNVVSDWNQLWQSGFYDGSSTTNGPGGTGWYWGINMNHRSNSSNYRYNGQIAIKNSNLNPTMYFRSTNKDGVGTWAKVLHNNGSQTINGGLTFYVEDPKIILKDVSGSTYESDFLYKDNKLHYRWGQGIKHTFEANAFIIGDYIGDHEVKISMNGNSWFNGGNVGIGTTLSSNPNNYKLAVKGTIGAHEVVVETSSTTWPDYVFEEDYLLMPLNELEAFLEKYKHLPEIPTAEEVGEKGQSLGEMNILLLKKVEELTLYIIELEEKNKKVNQEKAKLKEKDKQLDEVIKQLMERIEKLEDQK